MTAITSALSSLTAQLTTSLSTASDDQTNTTDAEEKEAEQLVAAAPGSSTALYDLFSNLPGSTTDATTGADRNAWLGNVTVRTVTLELYQEDE
ncbi:hypothetical protein [Prosthecodimorpha staleyi]|uniref:Uncharacterized protein n=1 Tax=Prosthecodimorpha staleyi TaxID=2840188 RepID=A0A947D9A6_9HYPH|nr:hypothetical protein [Prosthecodimorpha staleyi]MBT9291926.1 hypothetical protein [Prosthecodimorpha staleyi]